MCCSRFSIAACWAIPFCLIHSLIFAENPIESGSDQDIVVLHSFDNESELESIRASGVTCSLVGESPDRRLQIESGHDSEQPGISLNPKNGLWDASRYERLSLDVSNTGDSAFELGVVVGNPGSDDPEANLTVMSDLMPGESRTISVALHATPFGFSKPIDLKGMLDSRERSPFDPSKISQVILFLERPDSNHRFTINEVRFEAPRKQWDPDQFFPFVDEFGQFIHEEWPGKIASEEDFQSRRDAEAKELQNNPGPKNFSLFGGWKNEALRLKKQKHFRVEKVNGKWWLIDPEGYPFWSHGINSVSTQLGGTGTEHREEYFRGLPNEEDELGQFYFSRDQAHGFYADKTPHKGFHFYAANLFRKDGSGWKEEFIKRTHRRMRSWGMNTLAAWSDFAVTEKKTTPYTAFFRIENCPVLEGADSRFAKLVDVFDPQFKIAIRDGIFSCQKAIGDPWCIGYFVDNDLHWGDEFAVAQWILQSPADQAAKQVFATDLTAKYESIDSLNEAWGTKHESWEAFLNSTEAPDPSKAGDDLREFTAKFCHTYFGTIASELDATAPFQLYLGCRFAPCNVSGSGSSSDWNNETAIRAACSHCDVVSFQYCRDSASNLRLPDGEDKPVTIGEFHIGTLGRGPFHAGKVSASDQEHRAECYKRFVRSALANPLVVGAHWSQYTSAPISERVDGQNSQIGFVDLCDTPIQEIVEASRTIGNQMYDDRATH